MWTQITVIFWYLIIVLIYLSYWNLADEEYISLNEASPPSHINTHIPWSTGRGSGVVAIFNSSLLINSKPKLNYDSFKSFIFSLSHQTWKKHYSHLTCWSVLCSWSTFRIFLVILWALSSSVLEPIIVIIVGDFNIHVNTDNDCLSTAYISLLNSIGFSQIVLKPTQPHPQSCSGLWEWNWTSNCIPTLVLHHIPILAKNCILAVEHDTLPFINTDTWWMAAF